MNNTPRPRTNHEEPEPSAEESIPLDGKDPEGEKMMEDLGRDLKTRQAREAKDVDPEADPGPLPEQFPVS